MASRVFLVSIDTLRADVARSEGLDSLFSDRHPNYYTSSNWTLPAHAALFTGDSLGHGCHFDWEFPEDRAQSSLVSQLKHNALSGETIAEAFQERGWRTFAFVGGGFVSDWFGLSRGFESWDENSATPLFDRESAVWRAVETLPDRSFAFVHDWYVHDYFQDCDWPVAEMREAEFMNCEQMDRSVLREGWVAYRRRVRMIASRMEEFLKCCREDDLVVVVGDHGEAFGEHSLQIHHGVYTSMEFPEVSQPPFLVRGGDAPRSGILYDTDVRGYLLNGTPSSSGALLGRYSYRGSQFMYSRSEGRFKVFPVPRIDPESGPGAVAVPEELWVRLEELGYA